MHAVVLAAGAGERLNGYTAPFHKPLLVVNGKPLIVDVVAKATALCEQVIVVVAPGNATAIGEVLYANGLEPLLVIQQRPYGPGHALKLTRPAVSYCEDDDNRLLVLMGDNVLADDDLPKVLEQRDRFVIGTAFVSNPERFTMIANDGSVYEKETVPNPMAAEGKFAVWCGPLIVPLPEIWSVLPHYEGEEVLIGQNLNFASVSPVLVPCNTTDIGVPEALK